MTTIKIKEKTPTIETEQNSVDTQLELMKYATQVQSRIKDEITSDFTLCKLDTQDKEGITNMTVNAYIARRKIIQIRDQSHWWKWNNNNWEKTRNDKQLTLITQEAGKAFDMYMTKVQMVAILNRNITKNHMLNFLQNKPEPDENITPETTEHKIKNRIIKDKEKTEEKI